MHNLINNIIMPCHFPLPSFLPSNILLRSSNESSKHNNLPQSYLCVYISRWHCKFMKYSLDIAIILFKVLPHISNSSMYDTFMIIINAFNNKHTNKQKHGTSIMNAAIYSKWVICREYHTQGLSWKAEKKNENLAASWWW